MKNLLKVFLILIVLATGFYFFNFKNNILKDFIDRFSSTNTKRTETDSLTTASPIDHSSRKTSKKNRKAKTVKHDLYYSLDKYAKETPKHFEKDIHTLIQYLIQPAKSETDKARVIFTWIATHIKYDDKAFNSGNYPDYTAEYVLANKKAVCEGYSNIMVALCKEAGLEAEKVIGYAKGYGYTINDKFEETDHAWNAVKIDNKWWLMDATWAAGFGETRNNKLVSTTRFEPYWFKVNPKAFKFTHLPELPEWQLTDHKLTKEGYENLPYLRHDFFKLGFNPDKAYDEAVSGKIKLFVETYSSEFPIKIIHLPYEQNLTKGNEISFEIQSDYAEQLALIDGNSWHYFSNEGNKFTLTHKPSGKELSISIKINWFDKNFSTIMSYNVQD